MNVYDFDNTIYNGDSTMDFITWCIKEKPYLAGKLFRGGLSFLGYMAKLCSKTYFKEKLYSVFYSIPNIEEYVERFWDCHIHNIKKWYKDNQKEDDVIISASPEFLLKPACLRLGIKNLLASKVDAKTGFYYGVNCYGEEKVRRFKEKFSEEINEFYSDSLSDTPLALIAKKAFIVQGDIIIPWKKL